MHRAAIVAAPNIDKGAIANGEGSAREIRHRGLYRPRSSQLFVVVGREDRCIVSARGHDAAVVNRTSVEPYPGHIHAGPSAPSVANRIIDLRDGAERGEWR